MIIAQAIEIIEKTIPYVQIPDPVFVQIVEDDLLQTIRSHPSMMVRHLIIFFFFFNWN